MGKHNESYFVNENVFHCKFCNSDKNINEFPIKKNIKRGFMNKCKECYNKQYKEIKRKESNYYLRKDELKKLIDSNYKQCNYCKDIKILNKDFRKGKLNKSGYSNKCYVCEIRYYNVCKERDLLGKDYKNIDYRKYCSKEEREKINKDFKKRKKIWDDNKELYEKNYGFKFCSNCKELKLRDDFYKNKISYQNKNVWCKSCVNRSEYEIKRKIYNNREDVKKRRIESNKIKREKEKEIRLKNEKLLIDSGYWNCSKCKEKKSLDNFSINKNIKRGFNGVCLSCIKLRNIKWREENREDINKNKREYNKENKEKINESNKKWREKNREYFKEYNKKYYKKKSDDK